MKRLFYLHLVALLALSGLGIAPNVAAMQAPQGESDITRGELRNFDRFLDNHPELAEQLRKDLSLIKNEDFLEKHPQLQEWLKNHPEAREELKENPSAFMNRERGLERREGDRDRGDNDITRGELAKFDRFLDNHPKVAQELQKNPSLVNNEEFVEKHPALREFLKKHPGVREELKENPRAFMRRERHFEKHEGGEGEKRERRARGKGR